jgi:2-desacetyl-2-hydroxyethyl bacteriochlorophyllide A dehydrogenase
MNIPPKKAQAIVFHGPDDIRVEEVTLGPLGAKDILVRSHYSMVSSGTELRALTGYYKGAPFPIIPGYSTVGEIIACGDECHGYNVGDRVSCRNAQKVTDINCCWGGQASLLICDTEAPSARPILLPNEGNLIDYSITEIAAISLRGVEAANVHPGEVAIVTGQGPIGAFSAAWLHSKWCKVAVTDLCPTRLERAKKWGASITIAADAPDIEERLKALTDGGSDIVVESSGTMAGLALACRLLKKKPLGHGEPIHHYHQRWPRLLLQATYKEAISLDGIPGEGVLVLTPKDRGIRDRQKTAEAIRQGTLRASDYIDQVVPYQQAAEAYVNLRDNKDANFSLIFDWRNAQ